jgi:hypothetical protein
VSVMKYTEKDIEGLRSDELSGQSSRLTSYWFVIIFFCTSSFDLTDVL